MASRKGENEMKKMKRFCAVTIGVAAVAGVLWIGFGEKVKMLYTSLNSFKDKNLAHTFQHTPEIQPTKKICKGQQPFEFTKENNIALTEGFIVNAFSFCAIQYFLYLCKTRKAA